MKDSSELRSAYSCRVMFGPVKMGVRKETVQDEAWMLQQRDQVWCGGEYSADPQSYNQLACFPVSNGRRWLPHPIPLYHSLQSQSCARASEWHLNSLSASLGQHMEVELRIQAVPLLWSPTPWELGFVSHLETWCWNLTACATPSCTCSKN